MATIRKYRGKFNVQIRKKGYPFISKSFVSLTVAKKWAATTEADMERHLHVVIPDDTTVRGTAESLRQGGSTDSQRSSGGDGIGFRNLLGFFGGLKLVRPDL